MKRLPYHPYFDKGVRGWIVKTARKNYWRVAAWHDLDDLIQEGLLVYAICNSRYGQKVQNRRHFMALVQISFMNRITDMANARTREGEICISQIAVPGREGEALEHLAGGFEGDAELAAALALAPAELRMFLDLFNDPRTLAILRKPLRRRPGGIRETTGERMCRLLGIEYVDFETLFREMLGKPHVQSN